MPLPILTEFMGWSLSDLYDLVHMYEQTHGKDARPSTLKLKSPEELEQEVLNPVGPRYF